MLNLGENHRNNTSTWHKTCAVLVRIRLHDPDIRSNRIGNSQDVAADQQRRAPVASVFMVSVFFDVAHLSNALCCSVHDVIVDRD